MLSQPGQKPSAASKSCERLSCAVSVHETQHIGPDAVPGWTLPRCSPARVRVVAVLSGGNIVEQGRHSELMDRPSGAYATLLQLQMQAQRKTQDGPKTGSVEDAAAADDVVIITSPAEVGHTSSPAWLLYSFVH